MRDPNSISLVSVNNSEYNVINIGKLPPFDIEDYDYFDDKAFKKYMKALELMIRHSVEYQMMVQYMRENLEMRQCAFYENITNEETAKIKIHLHHEPLTLYDICITVFNKRCRFNESLEIELVAKEVMFLHYKLMIGLIPLSETVHILVHQGYLFVPTNKVLGNYKQFINLYGDYMDPDQRDILERIEQMTYTYNNNQKDILNKSFLYVNEGVSIPALDDLKQFIINRNEQDSKTDNCVSKYDSNESDTKKEKKLRIPAIIVKKEE